jgi:flagellar biosynthesis protein FliR
MPVKIKLGLSLLVVLVAAIASYYQHALGTMLSSTWLPSSDSS